MRNILYGVGLLAMLLSSGLRGITAEAQPVDPEALSTPRYLGLLTAEPVPYVTFGEDKKAQIIEGIGVPAHEAGLTLLVGTGPWSKANEIAFANGKTEYYGNFRLREGNTIAPIPTSQDDPKHATQQLMDFFPAWWKRGEGGTTITGMIPGGVPQIRWLKMQPGAVWPMVHRSGVKPDAPTVLTVVSAVEIPVVKRMAVIVGNNMVIPNQPIVTVQIERLDAQRTTVAKLDPVTVQHPGNPGTMIAGVFSLPVRPDEAVRLTITLDPGKTHGGFFLAFEE
jgi:hypothetical protein